MRILVPLTSWLLLLPAQAALVFTAPSIALFEMVSPSAPDNGARPPSSSHDHPILELATATPPSSPSDPETEFADPLVANHPGDGETGTTTALALLERSISFNSPGSVDQESSGVFSLSIANNLGSHDPHTFVEMAKFQPVPEPCSTMIVSLLAGGLLLRRRRSRP